jgi:hypothetical protein
MKSSRLDALGVVLAPGIALAIALGLGFGASARGDERSNTVALLALLEKDTAHGPLIADDVKQARDALERATRMHDANDEKRARLAEGLAAEWAQVARDLVRAAEAEGAATDARLAANDAGAHADRERSLLEEGIARQGRLRAELDGLAWQSKQGPDRTSPASADGGAATPWPKGTPKTTQGGSADAGVVP